MFLDDALSDAPPHSLLRGGLLNGMAEEESPQAIISTFPILTDVSSLSDLRDTTEFSPKDRVLALAHIIAHEFGAHVIQGYRDVYDHDACLAVPTSGLAYVSTLRRLLAGPPCKREHPLIDRRTCLVDRHESMAHRFIEIKDYAAAKSSWETLRAEIRNFSPDMILVSVTTPTIRHDLAACRIAKEVNPNILTVAKGAHFTSKDDEVLLTYPELDLVIRGESEHAIVEIAERQELDKILGLAYRKNGQVQRNADRPYIEVEDLDSLPFPARHLMDNNLYIAPDTGEPITMINTGRGCPHQCIYCAVTIASGYKLKVRSPKSIVDEIEECVKKHRIRNFFFRADTFTWDEKWVVDLCQMILQRNLKIRWGSNSRVDTISDKRLEWMKKAGCWV
jgi:hypothetical protein